MEQQQQPFFTRFMKVAVPFRKRLKILFSGRVYVSADYDALGQPMGVAVGFDKPPAKAFSQEDADKIAQQVAANRQAYAQHHAEQQQQGKVNREKRRGRR